VPKIKTHRGAKKRFSFTGTGKIKRNKAFRNHLLECKGADQKRNLKKGGLVSKGDAARVMKMLPNG
jgi:large subunit ribosomal protein L35